MRIAVTGASGNVGTAVLRSLLGHGHEVVAIARRPPEGTGPYAAAHWHPVDLTADDAQGRLRSAFEGADAVVHLAWGFQPTHDIGYLEDLALGGSTRVIAAVLEAGVPHLVHQSSLGVYSPAPADDRPVDETWPREGIASSPYSRHKVAVEKILDQVEADQGELTVTRTRPVLIGQRSGASGVLRYTVPALVPAAVLRLLPLLPVDGRLRLQLIHADDVANAIRLAIEQRVGGAFNLAADGVLRVEDLAGALGAKHVPVPLRVVRRAADLTWRAHLQQVDVGWLDMAYHVPLLDNTRARVELGWSPQRTSVQVLAEMVAAMQEAAADDTPSLRRRTVRDSLSRALRERPVAHRRLP